MTCLKAAAIPYYTATTAHTSPMTTSGFKTSLEQRWRRRPRSVYGQPQTTRTDSVRRTWSRTSASFSHRLYVNRAPSRSVHTVYQRAATDTRSLTLPTLLDKVALQLETCTAQLGETPPPPFSLVNGDIKVKQLSSIPGGDAAPPVVKAEGFMDGSESPLKG